MGLDIYIEKCRKPKIVEQDGKKYREDEYAEDVRLRREDVEKILDYVAHNRDYFGGFDSVPQVCALLDEWDALMEDGWVICFNAN